MSEQLFKKTINKIFLIVLTIILVSETSTKVKSDEINSEKWTLKCPQSKDLKDCIIAIHFMVESSETKKKNVSATAYIKKISSKNSVMNLLDKEEGTYKLTTAENFTPTLFLHLPFKIDLRKLPAVLIDKKLLGEMQFQYCAVAIGCKAAVTLNEKVLDFFKEGKILTVAFNGYTNEQILKLDFPLKGFTKAYKKIN